MAHIIQNKIQANNTILDKDMELNLQLVQLSFVKYSIPSFFKTLDVRF